MALLYDLTWFGLLGCFFLPDLKNSIVPVAAGSEVFDKQGILI